jgi:hypothetical protein
MAEKKTKYMKINTNSRCDFLIDGEVFEGEQNFRYRGNFLYSKNAIIEEIKSKNAAGNRFCYSLSQVYRSRYLGLVGARGGVVVKALCYKPAGLGFISQGCDWNFSVT